MKVAEAGVSRTLLPELAIVPGHLFWRASARVGVALDDVLPPGVDIHAYAALLALAADGASSQQWLADTVSVSRTTMARVAIELAAQGLVERVRNPVDRRSYALSRTAEGAGAVRTWKRHVEAVEKSVTRAFTADERNELHRLLLAVAEPTLAAETPPALRDSIGFLITRIHFRMHGEVLAALRDLDVEPRHLGSLIVLESMGPIPQAELARSLGISGASVVEIADHLERRGLVERRRLPTDRRTQVLHLLPGADSVAAEAGRRGTEVTAAMLEMLTKAERKRLVELLGRFVTAH